MHSGLESALTYKGGLYRLFPSVTAIPFGAASVRGSVDALGTSSPAWQLTASPPLQDQYQSLRWRRLLTSALRRLAAHTIGPYAAGRSLPDAYINPAL